MRWIREVITLVTFRLGGLLPSSCVQTPKTVHSQSHVIVIDLFTAATAVHPIAMPPEASGPLLKRNKVDWAEKKEKG